MNTEIGEDTNFGEREQAYFDKLLDLKYENECLKRENQELKAENRTLKEKLNKTYEFMKQFTINGINMLEHFLRRIGEWVQQKVAGMNRQKIKKAKGVRKHLFFVCKKVCWKCESENRFSVRFYNID